MDLPHHCSEYLAEYMRPRRQPRTSSAEASRSHAGSHGHETSHREPSMASNFMFQKGDRGDDWKAANEDRGHDICNYPSPFGPPRIREGKQGANWRNMRETKGVRGQHIMFIEGSVKIRDSCATDTKCITAHGIPEVPSFDDKYPPRPAPVQLPPHVPLKPKYIRAPRILPLHTVFAEHAREGFVYWPQSKKRPRCGKEGRCDKMGWFHIYTKGFLD